MPTTTTQTPAGNKGLVHRERLSRRNQQDAKRPWLAIAIGVVVVAGIVIGVVLYV